MDTKIRASLAILARTLGWWWVLLVLSVLSVLVGFAQQLVDSGILPALEGGIRVPPPVWYLASYAALVAGYVAAFHRQRLRADEAVEELAAARSGAPRPHLRSFPQIRTNRFGGFREWHVLIQNIGGASGNFSAQMEPVEGFGKTWPVPWQEVNSVDHKIDPGLSGTLVAFADEDVAESLVKRPVRRSNEQMELVRELLDDGYGEKLEFKLTVATDHPLGSPLVKRFRVAKGGIELLPNTNRSGGT